MKKPNLIFLILPLLLFILSCQKEEGPVAGTYGFAYPDSILYVQNQPDDYIVRPLTVKKGTYSGFPEGIEIDESTGAINVSKSETGLRYRIDFTDEEGKTYSTKLVISGISYADNYFYLKSNDTIVQPIYNAEPAKSLPVSGSVFDEGNLANNSGCAMATQDGKIDLASSIRQGMFGSPAQFGASKEVETRYRLNDRSNKAQNGLKVKFYYYRRKSDVPQDLIDLLKDREGVFLRTTSGLVKNKAAKFAKPRPPCIIVIAE